jgi:hypothetical protein
MRSIHPTGGYGALNKSQGSISLAAAVPRGSIGKQSIATLLFSGHRSHPKRADSAVEDDCSRTQAAT